MAAGMKKSIDLKGVWNMKTDGEGGIPARIPGSNYLALMDAGMEDPFYGTNEKWAQEKGHHSHLFSRTFTLSREDLDRAHLDFVGDGIDTACCVRVNGQAVGQADNMHRVWRFDIASCARLGENTVELDIRDPYEYMAAQQKGDPHLAKRGKEKVFIRKAPCHFGWDWGPQLAPSGVVRSVKVEAYDFRIADVRVRQEHAQGRVALDLRLVPDAMDGSLSAAARLTAPDGARQEIRLERQGDAFAGRIEVRGAKLWWVAGLGEQPLYGLEFTLESRGEPVDSAERSIGLRTVELDTSKDEYGEQFRFAVNGVPIFVRGADWIPPDQFVTRFTRDDAEFYVKSVRDAGMNMLRVWGGGMYESEDFYDMCDRYGILVWQDFLFACEMYPFYREDFVRNVREEVADNVRRLRHRASLALWCGNNEIDLFYLLSNDRQLVAANRSFFYETLKGWVEELDGVTAYWPGSPSSGHIDRQVHNFRKGRVSGDTHLWNVWHGMLPVSAYRGFPTRFCSEFGMESMPSMKTIRRISPYAQPDLFDDVMLQHQKSRGGNSKIMYYLLQGYRRPKKFEDFVYLSQIVQSDAVRFATESWRRRMGMQNGAIVWQLNDCWPVASWSLIDYDRHFKAGLYHARQYNKMLTVSADVYRGRADVYVINEYPRECRGKLLCEVRTFTGKLLKSFSDEVAAGPVSSVRVRTVGFDGLSTRDAYLKALLLPNGETPDEKTWLLVPDREARLPSPKISCAVTVQGGTVRAALCSDVYARYVYVDSDAVKGNWSDDYFDLEPGREKSVSAQLEEADGRVPAVTVRSLADVEPYASPRDDKRYRRKMWRRDGNWITYFAFKYLSLALHIRSRKD